MHAKHANRARLNELSNVVIGCAHRLRCVIYLWGTDLHLCMLINFGNPRLEIKRVVSGL
jgi:hypothetical protein